MEGRKETFNALTLSRDATLYQGRGAHEDVTSREGSICTSV